jgi:hypothetical protein
MVFSSFSEKNFVFVSILKAKLFANNRSNSYVCTFRSQYNYGLIYPRFGSKICPVIKSL